MDVLLFKRGSGNHYGKVAYPQFLLCARRPTNLCVHKAWLNLLPRQ